MENVTCRGHGELGLGVGCVGGNSGPRRYTFCHVCAQPQSGRLTLLNRDPVCRTWPCSVTGQRKRRRCLQHASGPALLLVSQVCATVGRTDTADTRLHHNLQPGVQALVVCSMFAEPCSVKHLLSSCGHWSSAIPACTSSLMTELLLRACLTQTCSHDITHM